MFRSVNFVFVFRLVFSSSLSLSLSLSCERTNERTNEPSVMTIAWCFWAFTLRNIRSNSSCFSQLIIHLVNANEKAKIILFLSLIYANAILNWICMRTLLRHRQSISVDKSESVICTNWCLASFVTRHRLNARNVFVHAKSKLTHWHFWLNRERSVKRNATFRTTRSLMKMIHFIAGKNHEFFDFIFALENLITLIKRNRSRLISRLVDGWHFSFFCSFYSFCVEFKVRIEIPFRWIEMKSKWRRRVQLHSPSWASHDARYGTSWERKQVTSQWEAKMCAGESQKTNDFGQSKKWSIN